MKTSTSIHCLNADQGLGIIRNVIWMLLNLLNNKYLPNRSSGLCLTNFCPDLNEDDWEKIHIKASPSRSLSDLFWLKLDWKAVKSELGSISVFDTGAGKGGYGLKLNTFAGGISSYFGVDFSPQIEWNDIMHKYPFITLKQQHSDDILDMIPLETNFFMSQSAIEHFESDLLYFRQIKSFIDKTNHNTIQVHLFPSAACLRLFEWHGIRQYTPRTISTINQLFNSSNTYSTLFTLGGNDCNHLHYDFITYPLFTKQEDWRESKTQEYRNLLKIAVEKDIEHGNYEPSYYALVIHSNFKKPVFRVMEGPT